MNVDNKDAEYVLEIINDFAEELIKAHKKKPEVIKKRWTFLAKKIGESSEWRYFSEAQTILCEPCGIEDATTGPPRKGTYMSVFDKIIYFMPNIVKVVFALLFKYRPISIKDIFHHSDRLRISQYISKEEMYKSIIILQDNRLIFLERPITNKIEDSIIGYNEPVYIQARKYCYIFWDNLMGNYLELDPERPEPLFK